MGFGTSGSGGGDSSSVGNGSGAVNVTTSSGVVVAANDARRALWIVNDSDTVIYLGFGVTAVVNQGIRLNASGGSLELNATNMFTGAINAIHGGTGNKVAAFIDL